MQDWEFNHRFFDRISRFCDRKIDSIVKMIESLPSIICKDPQDQFDHGWSFSKIDESELTPPIVKKDKRAEIRSFGIKRVKNLRKIRFSSESLDFWERFNRVNLFQRATRAIRLRLIFLKDRQERFDHGRPFLKDRRERFDHGRSALKIKKIERSNIERSKDRISNPAEVCYPKAMWYLCRLAMLFAIRKLCTIWLY